jgi:hypothetical protein
VDKEVLIPQDGDPFQVHPNQIVRIPGRAISGGSMIKAVVTGPAQIVSESVPVKVSNGNVLTDERIKEFDLQPTGIGLVLVDVIEESNVGGVSPIVMTSSEIDRTRAVR